MQKKKIENVNISLEVMKACFASTEVMRYRRYLKGDHAVFFFFLKESDLGELCFPQGESLQYYKLCILFWCFFPSLIKGQK